MPNPPPEPKGIPLKLLIELHREEGTPLVLNFPGGQMEIPLEALDDLPEEPKPSKPPSPDPK